MAIKWTNEEVEKVLVEVKKKAMTDKNFRTLVLEDPNKAIAQVAKKDVPAGVKIKIIESDPAYHMTFVLPQMVSADISDDELDKVAGGVMPLGRKVGSICGAEACGADACIGER